jgi:hypothetical protein
MSYEVLKQVEKDFSEKAQWNSFLELIKYKDFIRNSWFEILKKELNSCFVVENVIEKWGYISKSIWEYRWFVKEFGQESLSLTFNSQSLHLWANRNFLDIKKITSMLQEIKYIPIVSAFERHDEIHGADDEYKIIERGNFIFDENDGNDGHYSHDQLAWYARYKTKDFVEQIKNKIDRFRKDNNITELFIEINKECKLKQ